MKRSAQSQIALTGFGQDEDKQASRASGFDDHLTKPVEPDELDRVVTELLNRKPEVGGRAADLADPARA